MIRVYAVGGHRLTVLPHTPDDDIRDEALALARAQGIEHVLVLDRVPTGEETVVASITVDAVEPPGDAAVAEAQRIAAAAVERPRGSAAV